MRRILACSVIVTLTVAVGCGGSRDDKKDDQKRGGPPDRLTIDNVYRIRSEMMTYTDVQQIFAGPGEPTNEDRPGLMQGNKFVWKEGNKKVFVSFSPVNGKANGVAWEGFGGK